jgi:hypothetical protein
MIAALKKAVLPAPEGMLAAQNSLLVNMDLSLSVQIQKETHSVCIQ